ncbi:hypothetical protein [Streptomyces sp. NBC_00459]|uniref:hypothetical protein n=1 Tax=Streptomyces sp. NBC_00459 TaxID=2975749 RepID=UPI002E181232
MYAYPGDPIIELMEAMRALGIVVERPAEAQRGHVRVAARPQPNFPQNSGT